MGIVGFVAPALHPWARRALAHPTDRGAKLNERVRLKRLGSGVRFALALVISCLALALASCTPRTSGKTAPKVVDGAVDVTGWNFETDGPVRLDGDWEVLPEGSVEGQGEPPLPRDFVGVPWSNAHHQTRRGRELDARDGVSLAVTIAGAEESPELLLMFAEVVAEGFHAVCTDGASRRNHLDGGLANPANPREYRSVWAAGVLTVGGGGRCVVTVPRGVLGRVRMLSAPALLRANDAVFAFGASARIGVIGAAVALTAAVLALCLALLDRRDTVPRWAGLAMMLGAARVASVVHANLLPAVARPSPKSPADDRPWPRCTQPHRATCVYFPGSAPRLPRQSRTSV